MAYGPHLNVCFVPTEEKPVDMDIHSVYEYAVNSPVLIS